MNAKKFVGFLMMRPAFTQRNLTSILLVACFFGVYVMMGGKVTTKLPKVEEAGTFGEMQGTPEGGLPALEDQAQQEQAAADEQPAKKESPLQLLGLKPSKDRRERQRAVLGRNLYDEEDKSDKPLNKDGLIEGVEEKNIYLERRLERLEKRRETDSLSAIEERLQIRRR